MLEKTSGPRGWAAGPRVLLGLEELLAPLPLRPLLAWLAPTDVGPCLCLGTKLVRVWVRRDIPCFLAIQGLFPPLRKQPTIDIVKTQCLSLMLKAIFFDFDGVIVDSDRQIRNAFGDVITHFHATDPAETDWNILLGMPAQGSLSFLFPNATGSKVEAMFPYLKERLVYYLPIVKLMPGILKVLNNFSKHYSLAIITNRRRESLDWLMDKFDLRPYFKVMVAREDIANHKPHPEGIHLAMQKLGVTHPQEVIYVGDRQQDVEASRHAGVQCIFVSSAVEHFGADYHIQKISELPPLIEKLKFENQH